MTLSAHDLRSANHAIHRLVDALPVAGSWTEECRGRWLEAMTKLLDYAYETKERTEG